MNFLFVCFGPVWLTSAYYFHRFVAGFPQLLHPSLCRANARQTGRQIHRWVKTDRRGRGGGGDINPWLWSRKQCQMLLVMSTYNHFVRHDSLRTSKYILYTRVKSVALTCSQTSHCVSAQGTSDDNNCTKRYSGGHVYCEHTHTHTRTHVRTRTQTHTYTHTCTHSHSPPSPHIHTLSLHILHGGFHFQAIRLLVSH